MKFQSSLFALIAALLLLQIGCLTEEEEEQGEAQITQEDVVEKVAQLINAPIPSMKIDASKFKVNPLNEEVLELENGTKITIPENILVYENGEKVEGEVELSYREFHDATDLLLSGIPMAYDSAGATHHFQTAGMMEIRASQDGKEVFIEDGKAIEVEMASFTEGDYNSYYLNEESGNWEYLESRDAEENLEKKEAVVKLEKKKKSVGAAPREPKKSASEYVFDFDVDYSEYPELAAFKGVQWQYANVSEAGTINPETEEWVFGEIWTHAKVNPKDAENGLYYLTLQNRNKDAKFIVEPVLEGTKFENAMAVYEQIKKKDEEIRAKMKEEQQRLQRVADWQRTFQVSNFGIFNCDRILNLPNAERILAKFELDESIDNELLQIRNVYMVMPSENATITYGLSERSFSMAYSPTVKTKFIVVLPNDEVAVLENKDVNNAPKKGNTYILSLKAHPQKVSSPDEMRALINS